MVWKFSQVRVIKGQFAPREPKLVRVIESFENSRAQETRGEIQGKQELARNIGKFGKPSVPEIGILLYLEFQLLPLKLAVEHTEGSMCIGHCIVPVFSPGSGMLDLVAMASWICFYFGSINPVLKEQFRSTEFYVSTLYHYYTYMHSM